MAPKRSPRNSSGSKNRPGRAKGEGLRERCRRGGETEKEELARKVRERLKAKQAAEAAKDGRGGKRERGSDDATGDQETEKASSKRRRTDDPAPTPATTAEIQPARDDDPSQPRDRKGGRIAGGGEGEGSGGGSRRADARTARAPPPPPPPPPPRWRRPGGIRSQAPGLDPRRRRGPRGDGGRRRRRGNALGGERAEDGRTSTRTRRTSIPSRRSWRRTTPSWTPSEQARRRERGAKTARLAKKREAREAATAEAEVAADFFAAAAKAAKAAKAAVAAEGVGDNDVTPGARRRDGGTRTRRARRSRKSQPPWRRTTMTPRRRHEGRTAPRRRRRWRGPGRLSAAPAVRTVAAADQPRERRRASCR